MVDKLKLALEEMIEEWFSSGTKIIHPAFPAYLKASEKVEFERRTNGWYLSTSFSMLEKGLFKSLADARNDRTKTAEGNL